MPKTREARQKPAWENEAYGPRFVQTRAAALALLKILPATRPFPKGFKPRSTEVDWTGGLLMGIGGRTVTRHRQTSPIEIPKFERSRHEVTLGRISVTHHQGFPFLGKLPGHWDQEYFYVRSHDKIGDLDMGHTEVGRDEAFIHTMGYDPRPIDMLFEASTRLFKVRLALMADAAGLRVPKPLAEALAGALTTEIR
jgi:hypothetical protein